MTMKYAAPGEVIDVRPYNFDIEHQSTSTLIENDKMKVIRLVMQADGEIPEHDAPGMIIVQCLEGRLEFKFNGTVNTLSAGNLLYLHGNQRHSVRCIEACSILLTICVDKQSR